MLCSIESKVRSSDCTTNGSVEVLKMCDHGLEALDDALEEVLEELLDRVQFCRAK